MIIVHYKDGSTHVVRKNVWKDVPKKDLITSVEISSDFSGQLFTMKGSAKFPYTFFSQRVGYSYLGKFLKHTECGKAGVIELFGIWVFKDNKKQLKLNKNCPFCNKRLLPQHIKATGRIDQKFAEEQVVMIIDSRIKAAFEHGVAAAYDKLGSKIPKKELGELIKEAEKTIRGECVVIEASKTGAKVYFTNVYHMTNDVGLAMLGVKLE